MDMTKKDMEPIVKNYYLAWKKEKFSDVSVQTVAI